MGAGILPTTIHNNKIYFLFGKENKYNDTPGWSDFGGGKDSSESQKETAIREGTEELTGFLGLEKDLKKKLNKYGTHIIDNKNYRTHIFPMEYDDKLPFYYNNNQLFLQKMLDPNIIQKTKIFEKEKIRWIGIDEIGKMKKKFRSFYQNTIDLILKEQPKIEIFIRKNIDKHGKCKRKE